MYLPWPVHKTDTFPGKITREGVSVCVRKRQSHFGNVKLKRGKEHETRERGREKSVSGADNL